MSNKINQIQASYNPSEDRILLKIKTDNNQEYLAWITRRFMKLLLPILHGKHPTNGENLFDNATNEMQQMEKQQSQMLGDYQSDYKTPDNPQYPLGETPILLVKITFKDIQGENGKLVFEPEQGPGVILPYRADLLGPLIKVFSQAMEAAQWNMEMEQIWQIPAETLLQ